MLEHLRLTIRHLSRDWVYSLIKITGLAMGIACCMIIALYVRHELSYDDYHAKGDRIFRMGAQLSFDDQTHMTARTPNPLAPALQEEIPEIESFVRFKRDNPVVARQGVSFREEEFYYADASVFSVFSFPLKSGNPRTALVEPFSIVLTECAAEKYFGEEDPLGRTLAVEGTSMQVTGVAADLPANSHFRFDFLCSYATIRVKNPAQLLAWDNFVTSTYFLLQTGVRPEVIDSKLADFLPHHFSRADGVDRMVLNPLGDLHLSSRLAGDLGQGGDAASVVIFPAIALFILFIASINFVNLFIARASERAREVGVRKILGANRWSLVRQFLLESIVLVLLSVVLAIAAVESVLPGVNDMLGKRIPAPDMAFLLPVLGFSLVIGVISGLYPALRLSSIRPVTALKGVVAHGRVWRFGSVLVVIQFALSTAFISAGLIAASQLEFVGNKDPGFNKSQVVVVRTSKSPVQQSYQIMKKALQDFPGVVEVSATSHTPARGLGKYEARIEGEQNGRVIATYFVDENFLPTYEIGLAQGRNFSSQFPSDPAAAFLVNESAVRAFDWKQPIGKTIVWDGDKRGSVVGVVKDFHVRSLHEAIEPMVLHIAPEYFKYLSARVRADWMEQFLEHLRNEWRKMAPDRPLSYSFLDDDFGNQYRSEQRFAAMMGYASGLGISIACLGLVALVSLIIGRRVKEVGIRKVLGASAPRIAAGLSFDFLKLVVVGNLLSIPVVWLAMSRWLEEFAYRTTIGPSVFLLSAFVVLIAATVCIASLVIRTATTNPVESLRYE